MEAGNVTLCRKIERTHRGEKQTNSNLVSPPVQETPKLSVEVLGLCAKLLVVVRLLGQTVSRAQQLSHARSEPAPNSSKGTCRCPEQSQGAINAGWLGEQI